MSITRGVFIAAAKRTAIGRFNGAMADTPAPELGARVISRLLGDLDLDPARIDEVIMGQVLTAGVGQNPARQTAIKAGLPIDVPAFTLNKVCGSGLKAMHLAAQSIALGDTDLVIAGGQENMSLAPHLLAARKGIKIGNATLFDSLMLDGLTDAFHHVPMGVTGDRLAEICHITRHDQDAFALASHRKAIAAIDQGRFNDEIEAVKIQSDRETLSFSCDEQPRANSSLEALARLKPAFSEAGTVTPGNAASLNDGAAATILVSEAEAKRHAPLARVASWACAGVEPMEMGMGAARAARKALDRAGWRAADLDLIELNEAFAAQALAVIRALNWDEARVNVNGGAIALGHPIGASGCRVVVSLVHEMRRRGVRRGLAALCIGGGQGIAVCIET